jgi:hypothetical protein
MITAKQILESHFKSVTRLNHFVEIAVNPSMKELQTYIGPQGTLKFLADPVTKLIYVWDAYAPLHHGDVVNLLDVSLHSDFIRGEAHRESQGRGYVFEESGWRNYTEEYWEKRLKHDWSWTKKFGIDFESSFSKFRKELRLD